MSWSLFKKPKSVVNPSTIPLSITQQKHVLNILANRPSKKLVLEVLDDMEAILAEHCGPYGTFAMVNDPLRPEADPVFTTDGINIIRALNYKCPIRNSIKRAIMYIGSKIENAAGDGTTSSMLLTIGVFKQLLIKLGNDLRYKNLTYNEFCNHLEQAIEDIEREYQFLIVTPEKLLAHYTNINIQNKMKMSRTDIIGRIAYMQAMTSSHGDEEVSEAVVKMFTTIPEDSWNYISFFREGFETKQRIETIVETDQYVLDATIFHNSMLNYDLGTGVKYDEADLMILCHDLTVGDSFNWPKIKEAIETYLTSKDPLVILVPAGIDSETTSELNKMFKQHDEHKVALFVCVIENNRLNDLVGLSLVCGQSPVLSNRMPITLHPKVAVVYKDHRVKFNNLYTPHPNKVFHPLVGDKKFTELDNYLENIRGVMDRIKSSSVGRTQVKELCNFERLYNKVRLTKRAIVKIGGYAHDNAATVDVVMDTILAVRASLTKGTVLGSCRALHDACHRSVMSMSRVSKQSNDISIDLIDIIKTATEGIFSILTSSATNTGTKNNQQELDLLYRQRVVPYHNKYYQLKDTGSNNLKDVVLGADIISGFEDNYSFTISCIQKPNMLVAIQPAPIDMEVLKRIVEVIPKFVYTTKMIFNGEFHIE